MGASRQRQVDRGHTVGIGSRKAQLFARLEQADEGTLVSLGGEGQARGLVGDQIGR